MRKVRGKKRSVRRSSSRRSFSRTAGSSHRRNRRGGTSAIMRGGYRI